MKKYLSLLLLALVLGAVGYVLVAYYPYVFSKKVQGEILKVERVTSPEAIIASGRSIPASQIYSFAVAIRSMDGEIHTASTEDRQWAVAQAGQCVAAEFYPYPPWDLGKAGTYYGARLLHLYECPGGNAHPGANSTPAAPTATPPPSAAAPPTPQTATPVPSGSPAAMPH